MRYIDTCTRELQFVLYAGRFTVTEENDAIVKTLYQKRLDPELLCEEAEKHHLYPTVLRTMKRLGLVDSPAYSALLRSSNRYAGESIKLVRTLSTVMRIFAEDSIAAVPLKGPVLAQQIYGNVSLRPSADLDILVKKEDFRKAAELLEEHGFQNVEGLTTPKRRDYYFSHLQYLHMGMASDEVRVELHWRSDETASFTAEQLSSAGNRTKLGGVTMAVPNAMENLYFLVFHGSRHAFCRLQWLLDIYELVFVRKAAELQALYSFFEERKTGHLLALTMRFMEEMGLITDVEHYIQDLFTEEDCRAAEILLSKALNEYPYADKTASHEKDSYLEAYRKELKRRGFRIEKAFKERFRPTPLEFCRYELSDNLFFLYYPLRVLYWLWRKLPFCEDKEE